MTPETPPTAAPGVDETHDPHLESWLESANDAATPFAPQNLPFGRFRARGDAGWSIGVAIGDQVLDLKACGLVDHADMAALLRSPPARRRALRAAISAGLRRGSRDAGLFRRSLLAQSQVELGLPCDIGDYTDFYAGIHHATAVGRLLRPDNPLLPNYKWLPIAYHGRASTIQPSGVGFARPHGQTRADANAPPVLGPTARLDFELELGIVIGPPSEPGRPIPIDEAEEHIFGLTLLNDWSARDVQAWEYQPLGPFLAKNFATTISPWIVTLEALAPFRLPFTRPPGDPQPLPYLDAPANRAHGAIDIALEVLLQSERMRAAGLAPARISTSNFAAAAYWTCAQMVAHHSVNGCALRSGDLLGTGTLSGPAPQQAGSMLELSAGGRQALVLPGGEERRFLLDGDRVLLRAFCERPDFRRIGFGPCEATIAPARPDFTPDGAPALASPDRGTGVAPGRARA